MTDQKKVRTRFAPSPTGFLHIGGLRTVLYNYLLAKQNNGDFVLRLEDTDHKRLVSGGAEAILAGLKWAGLEPDEGYCFRDGGCGPYIQSERKDIYLKDAEKLLNEGKAYYCFCSPERLQELREEQQASKQAPRYDRKCADIPLDEAQKRIAAGEEATIRFRLPDDREVVAQDLVHGEVRFHTKDLQDPIIVKSDGMALYHLAVVVDDEAMSITHVMRGDEWLPSLPLHILLTEALGYKPLQYAHLPTILNAEGKKLSKRHDSVALTDFIEKGVLPEAMINFLAFLGWNPGGEREIYSLEELVQEFSLERVHKSGAVFDPKKLENMNAHYIRQKSVSELAELVRSYLEEEDLLDEYTVDLEAAVATVQERMKYLSEAPDLLRFYFKLSDYDMELLQSEKMKVDKKVAEEAVEILIQTLESIDDFSVENLKKILLVKVEELGWKNGQLLWPMRAALTGEQFSPGAFEVASVLGKEESLKRLGVAQDKLK